MVENRIEDLRSYVEKRNHAKNVRRDSEKIGANLEEDFQGTKNLFMELQNLTGALEVYYLRT